MCFSDSVDGVVCLFEGIEPTKLTDLFTSACKLRNKTIVETIDIQPLRTENRKKNMAQMCGQ